MDRTVCRPASATEWVLRSKGNKGGKRVRAGGPARIAAARFGRPMARRLTIIHTLATVARLGFVVALAVFAGVMIEGGRLDAVALAAALACLVLATALAFLADRVSARAERDVAGFIIDSLSDCLANRPALETAERPRGALVSAAQRHPGGLARLVIGHAVQRTMMAIGPLLAVAVVLAVSWQAAVALLLATPVMIVFFIFIGSAITARARAQEAALGRLAAQFADRTRTLPTIIANHAVGQERSKLHHRMVETARRTMGVLAVAFLNSGVLDFFTSLSIAILAVFLGLGHLGLLTLPGFSGLELWQSLLILLAAPEYFAPFRRYAHLYHAKSEGIAAAEALAFVFETPATASHEAPSQASPAGGFGLVLNRVGPIADFALPETGLVAIIGPSGSGKSTLLRTLAGVEAPAEGTAALGKGDPLPDWVAVDSHLPAGTLASVIADGRKVSPVKVCHVASDLGLLADALLPSGLDAPIAAGGENLSGGQRVRVALARMLVDDRPALLDEPTQKLDEVNAERVRTALLAASRDRLVVVATHDPTLIALASQTVALQPQGGIERAA